MRRAAKRFASVTTLLAGLVIAGCGDPAGDATGAEAARDGLVAAADAVCLASFDEIAAAPAPEIGEPVADPSSLVAPRIAIFTDMVDRLRALDVPPAEQARFRAFVDRYAAGLTTMAEDPGAYVRALADPDAPDPVATARLTAREIGLRVCAQSEVDFGRAAGAARWRAG